MPKVEQVDGMPPMSVWAWATSAGVLLVSGRDATKLLLPASALQRVSRPAAVVAWAAAARMVPDPWGESWLSLTCQVPQAATASARP